MKKRTTIAIMAVTLCTAMQAQTKTFADRLMLEMGFDATTKQHDVSPFGVSVNAGYRFTPRTYSCICPLVTNWYSAFVLRTDTRRVVERSEKYVPTKSLPLHFDTPSSHEPNLDRPAGS